MTYLHHCYIRMALFLGLLIWGVAFLAPSLLTAFQHNLWLNGAIAAVFCGGIFLSFRQVYQLSKEQQWLDAYECGEEKFPGTPTPVILAPLQAYLDQERRTNHAPIVIQSILSSIETRLDESREVNRYIIGLMIFFGLLGTFWGLSQTIGAITGVITGIDIGAHDIKQAFDTLKHSLQSPLAGMGTAFSCSMFGLATSMILGFIDLIISKTCTRFFQNLENKIAPLMRDHTTEISPIIASQTHSGPAYMHSLLEQTTESMAQINLVVRANEENRGSVVKSLQTVAEKISLLSEQMTVQQSLLQKIAQNHVNLQDQIGLLAQAMIDHQNNGLDGGIKEYLRNLDTTALQLLEEVTEGRNRSIQELRSEIRLVARTISALADDQEAAA